MKILPPKAESWLWMALAAGAALRLGVSMGWPAADFGGDAESYTRVAEGILAGKGWDPYWPPAWPAWLTGVLALGGRKCVLLHMVLWYLAGAWLADMWLKNKGRSFPERALFQGIWAVLPTAVVQGSLPFSQMPFTVCLMGALLLDHFFQKKNNHPWRSGFLWAINTLLRPASASLVFVRFSQKELRIPKSAVPFAIALLLPVLAWTGWISWQEKRVVAVSDANAYNFFLGNHADTPDYSTWWLGSHGDPKAESQVAFRNDLGRIEALPAKARQSAFRSEAWRYISHHPAQTLKRIASRFRVFWAFDTYGAAYLPSGKWQYAGLALEALFFTSWLLGVFISILHKMPGTTWVLVFVGLFMAPYLLAFSHPIYHFPLVPILAPWAFSGWQVLLKGPRSWVPGSAAYLMVGWAGIIFLFYIQAEWAIFWVSPLRPY